MDSVAQELRPMQLLCISSQNIVMALFLVINFRKIQSGSIEGEDIPFFNILKCLTSIMPRCIYEFSDIFEVEDYKSINFIICDCFVLFPSCFTGFQNWD